MPETAAADRSRQIHESWNANALAWTQAVRQGRIPSRRLATDAAIVEALLQQAPAKVLDVGCGEGWLARTLTAQGVSVVGLDASRTLIESAQALGGGTFHVLSYAELEREPSRAGGSFDAVVCNFSLMEEQLVPLLSALRSLLAREGLLYVQTVHPQAASGEAPYRDGWRTETFDSLEGAFPEAMPWYFRTLASWFAELRQAGFHICDLREPVHPETGRPFSLLLICKDEKHAPS